jgi:hypothetical protein
MIALAVSFYDVALFFHILAVVLAFGPTFAYGVFIAFAVREGGGAVPPIGRAIVAWDRIAGTLGMTVVLLSGLYLVSDGPWEASDFFVSWGFLAILILFGLTHGFFAPRTRQAVQLAERDLGSGGGKLSDEFDALSGKISKVGGIAGLIVVLTIYVMTAKPFL